MMVMSVKVLVHLGHLEVEKSQIRATSLVLKNGKSLFKCSCPDSTFFYPQNDALQSVSWLNQDLQQRLQPLVVSWSLFLYLFSDLSQPRGPFCWICCGFLCHVDPAVSGLSGHEPDWSQNQTEPATAKGIVSSVYLSLYCNFYSQLAFYNLTRMLWSAMLILPGLYLFI